MKKNVLHPVRLHKKIPSVKWLLLSLLFLLLPLTSIQAQVGLDLESGLKLEIDGGIILELDGNWINNGSFLPGDGTVIFNGTGTQTITNASGETFNKLFVNKTSGVVRLNNNITVSSALTLNSGDLDLNGQTIYLEDGAVLTETPGNTIIGESGFIVSTQTLDAPSGVDVGGLGFVITSAVNLGSTVVSVGHDAQSADGHQGILRYYDVTPANNSGLNATLIFRYDDSELNGNTESLLALYRSTDGGSTWSAEGGTVDPGNNSIILSGIDAFSRWTASSQPLVPPSGITVELRNSPGDLITNSGATIHYQPNSSGAYIDFGDGSLDPDGTETANIAAGTHRFRITYLGASQTVQQNVSIGDKVVFQTTLAVVELRNSTGELFEDSGATVTWQPGSSGAYVNFGDGTLDADGTEKVEVLPLTHRFLLSYQGATQTIQQNVGADSIVTFQTTLAVVELRNSTGELFEDSGATVTWQPGSSGDYVNFGDGTLDADGTEKAEVLPLTHRFSLAYQGATQTIQQNVGVDSIVTFQTTLAVVELRNSENNLIQDSGATVTWQSGSLGSYVNFGDGTLDADGTEKAEVLSLTHRFSLAYLGATQTIQQNVSADSIVTFQTTLVVVELRDYLGNPIANSEAAITWQPGSSGPYTDFGNGILDADGSEEVETLPLTHRFRLTYLGATETIQQNVAENPVVVFQTTEPITRVELRDSNGDLIQNSGATIKYQPGSSGGYVNFGDGALDADGTEEMETMPLTHRFQLTYSGATQTIQQNVAENPVVVFQTTRAVVELRNSVGNLVENSGATITWQPGSAGSYKNFGDGTLDANGTEALEVLPLTHRFKLTYLGAAQIIQRDVSANPVVVFRTTLAVVELRTSADDLMQNSGATVTWQSGSTGAYVNFGDGILDADGSEEAEVLPLTHRFRLTYAGATQTKQQNVSADSVVVFRTALAVVELRNASNELILNSNAVVTWQPGSSGSYVNFGDGVVNPDGTEKMEILPLTHRFRVTHLGETLTKQQNVAKDSIIVFTSASWLAKRSEEVAIESLPTEFALYPNYPNPFNPTTTIRFDLPEPGHVVLRIFNLLGQEVRLLANSPYPAGAHRLSWDIKDNRGNTVASGIYIYQLKAGDFVEVRKMNLQR